MEKKLGLEPGSIRNPDGSNARSDKKLGTLRKEFEQAKGSKVKTNPAISARSIARATKAVQSLKKVAKAVQPVGKATKTVQPLTKATKAAKTVSKTTKVAHASKTTKTTRALTKATKIGTKGKGK